MTPKPFGELSKGDVVVMYGRKRIVVGEPRPTVRERVVSVQFANRDGYLIGETLAFATDTVDYWGRASALRSSDER